MALVSDRRVFAPVSDLCILTGCINLNIAMYALTTCKERVTDPLKHITGRRPAPHKNIAGLRPSQHDHYFRALRRKSFTAV